MAAPNPTCVKYVPKNPGDDGYLSIVDTPDTVEITRSGCYWRKVCGCCLLTALIVLGLPLLIYFVGTYANVTFCYVIYPDNFQNSADYIIGKTNRSVNPCENFCAFAGAKPKSGQPKNWKKLTKHSIIYNVYKFHKEILKLPASDKDILALKQARSYYLSCVKNYNSFLDPPTETNCFFETREKFYWVLQHFAATLLFKDDAEFQAGVKQTQTIFTQIKEQLKRLIFKKYSGEFSSTMFWAVNLSFVCSEFPVWLMNASAVQQQYDGLDLNNSLTYDKQNSIYEAWSSAKVKPSPVEGVLCDMSFPEMWSRDVFTSFTFDQKLVLDKLESSSPPYYGLSLPEVAKFGIMGVSWGSLLVVIDWTVFALAPKQKCLLEQFSQSADLNELPDEKDIQNILGDAIGIQVAYSAWKNLTSNADSKWKSTALYTEEQTFFLTYAQYGCEIFEDSEEWSIEDKEYHKSSGILRAHGAPRNTNKFSEVWNCPSGSPMNPVSKCNLEF